MQRIRQDLSALFGSMGHPLASALAAYACAALAFHAYPLVAPEGHAGAATAATVMCLPLLLLTYWLGAGTLAFDADATRSCLPGSRQLRRRARVLALLLLLPAFALPAAALRTSAAGSDWGPTALGLILSPAFAVLALARRRRLIRQGSRHSRLVLWQAASRHGSRERHAPVQIIRTSLGGMFVQLSTRQLIVGAMLVALLIVTALGSGWLGESGTRLAISILTLVAAGLVSTAFLAQISKLTQGQIAELALMPGLGTPAAQYRVLCRAALAPPLLWLGIVLLLGSAGVLFAGEPLSGVGVLAVCIFIIWLTYTIFALQKLAMLPPKRQSFISEFLLLYFGVYAVYPLYAAHSLFQIMHLFWWAWLIPALLGVGIATAIGFPVRRLATAPHPFLASESAAAY